MSSKSEKEVQDLLNQVSPTKKTVAAKDKSGYKFKDELFDKEKSIKKKDGSYVMVAVDWRKYHIGGVPIIAFKGEDISKDEFNVIKANKGVDSMLVKIGK